MWAAIASSEGATAPSTHLFDEKQVPSFAEMLCKRYKILFVFLLVCFTEQACLILAAKIPTHSGQVLWPDGI